MFHFSAIHPSRSSAAMRRGAEIFHLRFGRHLIGALGLIDGEAGVELGYAFRVVVPDCGMPPSSCPLRQVIDSLAGLLARIDAAEERSAPDAHDRDPARIRHAA